MRYFGAVVDGFGLGGVDVKVGDRVDVVVETDTVVEDFTEVVKVLVEEILLELELATPGMHWPGDVSHGIFLPCCQDCITVIRILSLTNVARNASGLACPSCAMVSIGHESKRIT